MADASAVTQETDIILLAIPRRLSQTREMIADPLIINVPERRRRRDTRAATTKATKVYHDFSLSD